MFKTEELATLIHVRQELYDSLGLRQDSLFELVDAVLTAPQRSTLVRLSLTAGFRRRWPSTCDALADGSVDVGKLRSLFARTLADSAVVDGRAVWVIDGTNWPRPSAAARLAAKRDCASLVVSVVGGRAGDGRQLGVAPRCAPSWTDGEVGDDGRSRADRQGAPSSSRRRTPPSGNAR